MKLKLASAFVTVSTASAMIAACSGGGGSGSSKSSFGSTITSQFIDAPVKGLPFTNSNGIKAATLAEGKFSCKRGEMIQFTFNDLDLGYAPCDTKIFIQDLIQGTAANQKSLTWDQAAAVIQSFALTNGKDLDLSNVDLTKIDTSTLSNSSFGDASALQDILDNSGAAYPEDVTLPTAKTTTDAVTHANASLVEHNQLEKSFKEALENMAGEDFALKGRLTSGDKEFCYNYIAAQAYVDDKDVGLTFNVESAAGASHSDLFIFKKDLDISCKAFEEGKGCDVIPSERLPKAKIITGPKTEMIFQNITQILLGNTSVDVLETNNLSLTATVKGDTVTARGSFIINQVVLEGALKDETNTCVYQIESTPILE